MLLNSLTRDESMHVYANILNSKDHDAMRRMCREDLFFLLTIGLRRKDANRDWIYARCREVERNPDGMLDLWAREHYKSTIITFAKSIQDILINPEETICIFSHTRPIAKGFMEQIKRELESNEFLKNLFPDILFQEPKRESPKWSLDNGLLVRRKTNPNASTLEAWGLVDGQPTSKHFSRLVYDDVVTRESVTTPEQIAKVTDAWALSLNLGARGGKRRYIGTRYHMNDTYKAILDREAAIPRIHPATHDGTIEGKSVFLEPEDLKNKRREMGPYIYAAQMLLNPTADRAMGFRKEWLRFYDVLRNHQGWNFYMLVDPANEKKKTSDYTVIEVIGMAPDGNYYLVDAIRDRLNLTERTKKIFEFHRKYRPIKVGYEKYGMQSDIEHIQYVMEQENYRFTIVALGGSMAKTDRIKMLVPIFEQGRFYLPHSLMFIDYEHKVQDFIKLFLEDEYFAFPVAIHDDMLDCKARILDPALMAVAPEIQENLKFATMSREPDRVQTEYDLFAN